MYSVFCITKEKAHRLDKLRVKYNTEIIECKQKQRCDWLGSFKFSEDARNFVFNLQHENKLSLSLYTVFYQSLKFYLGSRKVCLLSLVWPGPYILERSSSISLDDLERKKWVFERIFCNSNKAIQTKAAIVIVLSTIFSIYSFIS